MSYIDTFDHEFLGFFAGLPLYHPLEIVPNGNGNDFGCTPANLVLGGGSGEHPALIIREPELAVAYFLQHWLDIINERGTGRSEEFLSDDIWDDFISSAFALDDFQGLEVIKWRVLNYHKFYQTCLSSAFRNPFDPTAKGTFERWLAANFGEFIFYSMPELIPNLYERLPYAQEKIKHVLYGNILTPPPGYPVIAGRKTNSDKRIYGVTRWW